MELSYDNMVRFMEAYLPDFSEYGQDPVTAWRMHDYFAPDVQFIGHVGLPEPLVFNGRDEFLAFDVAHPSSYERLTPLEMVVDDKSKMVSAVIKFEFIDRASGQVLAEESGVTHYQLVLDEKGSIKISKVWFFPERLAPGTLSGAEIFFRDIQPL